MQQLHAWGAFYGGHKHVMHHANHSVFQERVVFDATRSWLDLS